MMMLPLIINSYNSQFSSEFNETSFKLKNMPLPFYPRKYFIIFYYFLEKSDFSVLVDLEKFHPW